MISKASKRMISIIMVLYPESNDYQVIVIGGKTIGLANILLKLFG